MRVQPIDELITVLSEQAEHIKQLETHAAQLVQQRGQIQRYRSVLEEKARVLAGLVQVTQSITKKMPPAEAAPLQQALSRFSQSASTSLRIGSHFYMSALLYPQDHQQGQPNDLEVFIADLKEKS